MRRLLAGSGRLGRPIGAVLVTAALALALTLLTGGHGPTSTVSGAAGQVGSDEVTPQTDASVPARDVTMLGSSPAEAPDETWGIGEVGNASHSSWVVVRYSANEGWSLARGPLDAAGQPLPGFEPASTLDEGEDEHVLAGELTASGSGVLLGTAPGSEPGQGDQQVVLVRNPGNPGNAFQQTAPLPATGEAALEAGESLYSERRAPLIAALDESGHAGALVVPVQNGSSGLENRVLHWDGETWTSEPIKIPAGSLEGFRVLAIGASSPTNAWLLAQLSSSSNAVALFRRHPGPGGKVATWVPVAPAPGAAAGEALKVDVGAPFTVPGTGDTPTAKAQLLTVTDEGVWIDGERTDASAPVTMFFKPAEQEPAEEGVESGEVLFSWCNVPQGLAQCDGTLPAPLPSGPYRSFAWADSSARFGQRVITGLNEGVSLRLEGTSFTRVLALGGSQRPNDVGGSLGAAFSEAREGWLGSQLPVHLTLGPVPSRLAPYPVPFHRALSAIAAAPGEAVGALSSQALAVGDQGEVARWKPGEGWLPESLFLAGGHIATTPLRAVAWPTPTRAYAVGVLNRKGEPEMWLWRGETGLWEPDPATPANFRGDLLGIAFDPNDPSRGYAVGQQGVLLRYGKTWTQEPLPPELQDASFTSIAFAGSEAIVAYRVAHESKGSFTYTGGLLVNNGSGWSIDAAAAAALGAAVPWAVAGLPDGGAALSATMEGFPGAPLILERNTAEAAWQPTPAPYPDFEEPGSSAAPGSLSLFREGGALRLIGSGGAPNTSQTDDVTQPPAGFPPALIAPYPIATGYVIRQTANGWSDEEHERNGVQDPPGEYKQYDMVYTPDPTSAVLIDPTGTQGWAVGGFFDPEGRNDTADVARYPADGVAPPGFGAAPVQVSPSEATFAIGGGAQCLASCADRARARIGPDVWLASAQERAAQIAGVRAFFDTGPRVSTGLGQGLFPVDYALEEERYAELLGGPLPAYAVPSATDRGGASSECSFQEALSSRIPFAQLCAAGAPSAYYAFESTGASGPVRLMVLDDSAGLGTTQLAWLIEQLDDARAKSEPAIAIGSADLNAQIAAGDGEASALAAILVGDGASAYFYDSPEQNVTLPLRVGSGSIETFGSGTLGYVNSVTAESQDFAGHSGFLLGEVDVAARNPATNVAPVTARLIPDIGELALEAQEGVLVRRSHTASFVALARRPRAGGESARNADRNESANYIPIPANCIGASCADGIFPGIHIQLLKAGHRQLRRAESRHARFARSTAGTRRTDPRPEIGALLRL